MSESLTFRSDLYLSESIKKEKLDKIKNTLKKSPIFSTVVIITLSRNPSDQLEFYSARQLIQPYYQKNPPHIVGIAKNSGEAMQMIEKMVQDCMKVTGGYALKEFLSC